MKGADKMEINYKKVGDYYLPELEAPEAPKIGKYGMLRRTYLQEHQMGLYTGMMIDGTLNEHLEEIDRQANEMMEQITEQMVKERDIDEALKARDQMSWVGEMNNIRSAAEEIVLNDLIYS